MRPTLRTSCCAARSRHWKRRACARTCRPAPPPHWPSVWPRSSPRRAPGRACWSARCRSIPSRAMRCTSRIRSPASPPWCVWKHRRWLVMCSPSHPPMRMHRRWGRRSGSCSAPAARWKRSCWRAACGSPPRSRCTRACWPRAWAKTPAWPPTWCRCPQRVRLNRPGWLARHRNCWSPSGVTACSRIRSQGRPAVRPIPPKMHARRKRCWPRPRITTSTATWSRPSWPRWRRCAITWRRSRARRCMPPPPCGTWARASTAR